MIRQANFNTIREAFAMFYQICFGMVPEDLNENLSLDEAKFVVERSNTRDHELWLDCRDVTDEEDVAPQPVVVGESDGDLILSWFSEEGVVIVSTLAASAPHVVVVNGHCLDVQILLHDRPEFKLVGPDRTEEAEELDHFVSDRYADEKYYGILNNIEGDIRREWHAVESEDPGSSGWVVRMRLFNGPFIMNSPEIAVNSTEEAKKLLARKIQEQADAVEYSRES